MGVIDASADEVIYATRKVVRLGIGGNGPGPRALSDTGLAQGPPKHKRWHLVGTLGSGANFQRIVYRRQQ